MVNCGKWEGRMVTIRLNGEDAEIGKGGAIRYRGIQREDWIKEVWIIHTLEGDTSVVLKSARFIKESKKQNGGQEKFNKFTERRRNNEEG